MSRPRIANEGPTRHAQRPAPACSECGTVWGCVGRRGRRAERIRGRCHYCYWYWWRHRAAAVAAAESVSWAIEEGYVPSRWEIDRRCAIFRLLAPRQPQGYGVVFRVHRIPALLRPHLEIMP